LKPDWPICLVPPYSGQAISLATRHAKERAMARAFHAGLGADLVVAPDVDTDELGTFCGERARTGSAAEVCLTKAEIGMKAAGLTLGVASEGSFGPHPLVPLLAVGEEWMTFVDRGRDLVIVERLLARRTNFSHRVVSPDVDLTEWLALIGFPSHGVIVRPHHPLVPGAANKGIQDPALLASAIGRCCRDSADGLALVETDMRAHMNPTRMASIRTLAFRLVRRIATPCPRCKAPGWGVVDTRPGLPCSGCGCPTELILTEINGCVSCPHREERPRPDGLRLADPAQCSFCNP
jgi:hypothetical protein